MTGSDVRGDVLQRLDTAAARRWAVVTRAAFAARRAEIDALNVFPVPDGDTGTNLYLTFDAGLDAARVEYEDRARRGQPPDDEDLATEADVFARALLLTARGNSGVILSQIFRGFADEAAATGVSGIGAQGLAAAMTRADELAWASVAHPVEGTILSVSRAASRAATEAAQEHGDDLYAVSTAALEAARTALAATPSQLPRLAQAGVVDAGGAGYVLLLESLERVVTGDIGAESFAGDDPLRRRAARTQPVTAVRQGATSSRADRRTRSCTCCPTTTDEAVAVLKQRLDGLGDSLLVVGTDDLHNVHVHVDDVGAAIEAGIAAGRPHRIKVTHFRDQMATRPDEDAQAVVTCAAGEGLAGTSSRRGPGWCRADHGAGPTRRSSSRRSGRPGAGQVILLPNDGDTLLAANAAAKVAAEEGVDLRVVHARTAVQGIAALAVYDPDRPFGDNVLEMSGAAAATRNGAVTVATKEALTSGGPCRPGDVLGVVDGDIVIVGDDLARVGAEVVERLLSSGGELLTVVSGEDATPALGEDVAGVVRRHRRDLEVSQIYGGQPVYPLLLGVE